MRRSPRATSPRASRAASCSTLAPCWARARRRTRASSITRSAAQARRLKGASMLEHHSDGARPPDRIVLIGANSFIGKALRGRLEASGAAVLALGRADVDLTHDDAGERLAAQIRPTDSVAAIAAKAPCRNADDFLVNALLIPSLASALNASKPAPGV